MRVQSMVQQSRVPRPEWFKAWFDTTYYHQLYSHRDDRQAAVFIDELIGMLQPPAGSRILDLGCGSGRHSKHLASKGFRVTGMDLAKQSINRAKRFETESLKFLRHDMRFPFGCGRFDYVFSFFTSFGYFKEDEHHAILRNIADGLTPGGTFVLDYLNTPHAEAGLVPSEEKEIDGVVYRLTRWTDEKHFFKKIAIEDNRLRQPLVYTEQVARFSLGDFICMLALHGLRVDDAYGDYRLDEYKIATSPRLIVVAKKS
jgi:SAM-dependent methyltransferase